MRQLKIILGIIYPILIILLCLSNCRGCINSRNKQGSVKNPADTSSVVEQAEHTGHFGNLKITLLWNFPGDIDLHVTQPNGKTIYFERLKDTSTGGFLDVDNRNGGNGSAENVFWENPPKGEYQVKLVYYKESLSTGIAGAGTCSVVIFQQGKSPQTYQVEMNNVGEQKNIVKLNIR